MSNLDDFTDLGNDLKAQKETDSNSFHRKTLLAKKISGNTMTELNFKNVLISIP